MGAPETHEKKEENIWKNLLQQASNRSKLSTLNVILAGNRQCGKSMLLKRLESTRKEQLETKVASLDGYVPSYSWFDVLDTSDNADEILARVGVWSFGDARQVDLLQLTIKPELITTTVAVLAVDLSAPWSIKASLELWISALEERINTSVPKELLEERRKTQKLGIPIVIVGCKVDEYSKDEVVADYVQYYLRRFCLNYGATLVFTSAKDGTNCELLERTLISSVYPDLYEDVTDEPQVIDREAIYVPLKYDSYDLIEQSLVGTKAKWNNDLSYEKIVPKPSLNDDDDVAFFDTSVNVADEQEWLEKLEKAGAITASPDKKMRTINDAIKTTPDTKISEEKSTTAAATSSRGTKDVNPAHLANFFNNLLTRSEKERKKDGKIRQLAKKELGNMG